VYSNSAAVRSFVVFGHIGGLVSGGGCAIAADLGLLRAVAAGPAAFGNELARVRHTHRIVIGSLAIVTASGLLLMFANFDAYVASWTFWLKMALVAALLLNGALVARESGSDRRASPNLQRARLVSIASLVLWLATTLAGAVLPNVV
jgi:hypothetical protein